MSDFEWNAAAVGQLRALWAQPELSTGEIGRRMGCGKNAAVGKAHRLGLPSRPSPIRTIASRPRAPKPAGKVTLAPVAPPPGPARPAVVLPPQEQLEPPPVVALPASRGTCCWPEGDPRAPGFRFCGQPRQRRRDGTEQPYCAAHAERAYLKHGQVAG